MLLDTDFEFYRAAAYFDKSNGYYRVMIEGKRKYLHRVIIGAGKGELVDHINMDKTDNRICNLRIATKSLNNYNKVINNPLGRGIYFDSYGKRYRACISENNRTLKLGSFKCAEDAKIAYNKKAREIYGDAAFQHQL